MKIPYSWLKDYAEVNVDPHTLGDKLTLSGSALEEVIIQGDNIKNVVTCKIKKIEKHPDADRLSVCQVDIGTEEIQIVTAATNMKEQDIVPVALHKSILADGTEIKKGKMRGVVSNGMFCSEEELGIAGDEPVHGLMILPADAPIGMDIKEYLGLNKAILDFEITSNRPDCLSMIGMARETAATLRTSYKMPNFNYEAKCSANINDELKVEVRDELCRRYMAKGVKNVKVEPSPGWMQERLLEAGVRPINNIVDITNFVMLELGQPMHAFDARQIESKTIVVERALDGEKFTTLDEIERELDSSILMIKDGSKSVAIAGIMGGLNSEIQDDTTEVIFESANFEGTNIRVSSKKLNLRSESSSRFDKDIDPNLAKLAIDRACALICELGCGEVMEGTIDVYNNVKEEGSITVDSNWINKFLGTEISKEEMKEALDSLDLKTELNGDDLVITIPTFRIDIAIKEDIAEEVARIYGYDKIPTTIFKVSTEREPKHKNELLNDKVIEIMVGSGINQSISYSFVSPKVFDKVNIPADSELRNVVKIKNPLGEDYSVMRTTTLNGMLSSLATNYNRRNKDVRLYELGNVYRPKSLPLTELPDERMHFTLGMYGNGDFFDMKGVCEEFFEKVGMRDKIDYDPNSGKTYLHPGRQANMIYDGKVVGYLGEVHPLVADTYGIGEKAYVAVIDILTVLEFASFNHKYTGIAKYPAVTRDLSMVVPKTVLAGQIEHVLTQRGGKILESYQLFDIYEGNQIKEGFKSMAYSLVFRHHDKTLEESEITAAMKKILNGLEGLGIELRS